MTQVHYNLPPELAQAASIGDASKICLICLMFAKGDQVAGSREVWQPLVNDGKDREQKWIPYDGPAQIREAVVMGICDILPGILMPLCWDHLGAIAPPDPAPACTWCGGTGRKKGGLEAAAGPLPRGLANGHRRGHG